MFFKIQDQSPTLLITGISSSSQYLLGAHSLSRVSSMFAAFESLRGPLAAADTINRSQRRSLRYCRLLLDDIARLSLASSLHEQDANIRPCHHVASSAASG